MVDIRLDIDPAVDVVGGAGKIRFVTPRGGFALKDPEGLAQAITTKCRAGLGSEEIIAGCANDEEKDAARELISFLQARNILTPQNTMAAPPADISQAWLRHFAASRQVPLPAVDVRGEGQLADTLRSKLLTAGFPNASAQAPACIVAVSDTPELAPLRQLNREAMRTHVPFLPVWLDRATVRWGPMTLPGATGCLECLLHRMHNNRRRAEAVDAMDMPGLSVSPLLCEFGAVLALSEVNRWALDAHVETDLGVAWHFDWLTMRMSGNRVLRLPRCHACGFDRDV